jgi:PAS domain-containing protein
MLSELQEPKANAVWPQNPGEMAHRIREYDWSSTSLGRVETWPIHLRAAIDIMLGCGFPTTLQWGRDLVLFYNDAYISLIGPRHPVALGKPILQTFPEIAEPYRPMANQVFLGEVVTLRDQLFRYTRDHHPVDTWFDLSYSPVHGPDGSVAGILAIGLETTARVLAEREKNHSERALRQSEQRLKRVLETEAVGVIFFNMAPSSTPTRSSSA